MGFWGFGGGVFFAVGVAVLVTRLGFFGGGVFFAVGVVVLVPRLVFFGGGVFFAVVVAVLVPRLGFFRGGDSTDSAASINLSGATGKRFVLRGGAIATGPVAMKCIVRM